MIEMRSKDCQLSRYRRRWAARVDRAATQIEGDATFDKKPGES